MSKKIVNWSEYNEALVRRGDVTFWFSEEILSHWTHTNPGNRRGRPFIYSDQAVETLLVVREVFHLTYRGAEGLGRSLFALLNVQNSGVPDYTSLCKHAKNLDVAIKVQHKMGNLDVAVDSTGLKGLRRRRVENTNARQKQASDLAKNSFGDQCENARSARG